MVHVIKRAEMTIEPKKTMAIKTKMDSNIEHIKSLGSQTSATDNKIEAASSWSH